MKRKNNMKHIFWTSTVFLFALNIVGIIIFRNNISRSTNTFLAPMFFILVLFKGLWAYGTKDEYHLLFKRWHSPSRFYKYNRPTQKQLNDFYFKATIYFAPIPFYLPLAAFSSKNAHSLWLLLLMFVPQFTFIGMGISELSKNVKADKQKQEQHEKERKEQERRESMGKWK